MSGTQADELMVIDDSSSATEAQAPAWNVLIVDDDEDIHRITVFALLHAEILGRRLRFLHAYSSAEALTHLTPGNDIAVILLDVVMEREDAGLQLVHRIRDDLGLDSVRIILRTGQPGFAPEVNAIRDYDINDYRLKSELTHHRLYAAMTTAIRSFQQIRSLDRHRRGLDIILGASRKMMTHRSIGDFADDIIDEIQRLLPGDVEGLVCTSPAAPSEEIRVITGSDRYSALAGQTLAAKSVPATVASAVRRCFVEQSHRFEGDASTLFCAGKSGANLVIHVETGTPIDSIDEQLLALLCAHLAVNLDNQQLVSQLRKLAYRDPLLHIPNRQDFIRRIERARHDSVASHGVALIDIDHFSEINDALGHHFGDTLLKAVAARLIDTLPKETVIARIAGDTFGVLGRQETIMPEVLAKLFRNPFLAEDAEQTLNATIGLARLADIDVSNDGSEVLKAANIALNQAKIKARGEALRFSRDMEIETQERLKLLRELREAFDHEQLFLAYQPQYDLRTRKITGVEALLRWRNHDGMLIPPDKFIPLAESSGLIIALGDWVLRRACLDLQALAARGFADLRMAVNVSASQFRHPDFVAGIDRVLEASDVAPGRLELEITETVAMLDANLVIDILHTLKQRGIAIAIDDFGTGFSSLKYLERFDVDRLKIDQSFVRQMLDSHESRRIVETIVQLAQSLKLSLTAEGVEHDRQAERLADIGCQEAQGYLFARPMAFADLCAFLSPYAKNATAPAQ
ncbi:EAL domain-containing protein [uncultured Propionivibrio sp.]|uniref:GGDEF/EAL domain-containing response regulator n=1 Tax=uncultured Propionivibrio sp. TaxID=426737 RepID=UPI0029C0A68C|nr:EAL domain-containing protein [uncultured Propionivibrio sp.]